jgi:hypothetical protein
MIKTKLQKITNIFQKNQTLYNLFAEFDIIFENVSTQLIEYLISVDSVLQENTVYNLGENPDSDSTIANINEYVSRKLGLFPGEILSPHESNYRNYTSSEGTAYPYFLKWIYFCYKYFNEEQFFFNNLLTHLMPNYDSEIISSTNNLKVYFDGLGIMLDTMDQKLTDIYNLGDIDSIDEKFLQHVGQLLGYQKEDFSIENISFRELIKNLIEIYKVKGTEYSFKLFFKFLGFDVALREYYWDRDSKNSEEFASVTETDHLYYLTIKDPRNRVENQQQDMLYTFSQQPINTSDWVDPKDLQVFKELQAEGYTVRQILGFDNSDLEKNELFTYFKTNFVNFKLIQFYNKKELTNKDTETILKYIRYLTPVYVSAFVEVVTTPWEDIFEMSNPDAENVILIGDPGVPRWIDILLPFIFVTLRDYIPLKMMPAGEDSLVILQQASSDINLNGYSDSALPTILGNPSYGLSVTGTVTLSGTYDLAINKFINLKIDKGRGEKIELTGVTCQTYTQLISKINEKFTSQSVNAIAVLIGGDVRITSLATGTDSKIILVSGLTNDLFSSLGSTPETPVDGNTIGPSAGYQEFGLTGRTGGSSTGLNVSKNYFFYINVDDDDFYEIDCSGANSSVSTPNQILNAINNHYELKYNLDFLSSIPTEKINCTILQNNKVVVCYRDTSTNMGKLEILNNDGSYYRSGISFSFSDVSIISVSPSKDLSVPRFIVFYKDSISNYLKLSFYSIEGNKVTTDIILESSASTVTEIKSVTMSNNKIAVIYTINSGGLIGRLKIINMGIGASVSVDATKTWFNGSISSISVTAFGTGLAICGNSGAGGQLVYLDVNGDPALGLPPTLPSSTKNFTGNQVTNTGISQTENNKLIIAYSQASPTINGYISIWDSSGNNTLSTVFTDNEIGFISNSITDNLKTLISYVDITDSYKSKYIIFSDDGIIQKKENTSFDTLDVDELCSHTNGYGELILIIRIGTSVKYVNYSHIGLVAELTSENKLKFSSISAGNIWDDNVENYAIESDKGHRFVMDGTTYESDSYYEYYKSLGVNFTQERNRYSTFWASSPEDDLLDLIQEALDMIFTIIIGAQEFPYDRLDKIGDYTKRNGYITRDQSDNRKYTRHLDINNTIKNDEVLRTEHELNWASWQLDSTPYDEWNTWNLAFDNLHPTINYSTVVGEGSFILDGLADTDVSTSLPVISGLLGYWSLNESSGNIAYDTSGNNRNGVKYNTSLIAGKSGYANSFNGTNSYIGIPSPSGALSPTSGLTVCGWFYNSNWSGIITTSPISILSKTQTGGYNFMINSTIGNGYIGMIAFIGGGYRLARILKSALSNGWHYFAGTWDGRYLKLYIDNVLANTYDHGSSGNLISYTFPDNYLMIGCEAGPTNIPEAQNFNGYIDEVCIYDRALNTTELTTLYNWKIKG